MVEKTRRYAAMVRGGASLIRMRMDAVETAAMLTKRARLGGIGGSSLTANQR